MITMKRILDRLYKFARDGNTEEVAKLLFKSPSLANVADKDGWTALHYAASRGNEGVVKILLPRMTQKAIDVPNNEGWTALHWAVFGGNVSIIRILHERMNPENIETEGGAFPELKAIIKKVFKPLAREAAIDDNIDQIKEIIQTYEDYVNRWYSEDKSLPTISHELASLDEVADLSQSHKRMNPDVIDKYTNNKAINDLLDKEEASNVQIANKKQTLYNAMKTVSEICEREPGASGAAAVIRDAEADLNMAQAVGAEVRAEIILHTSIHDCSLSGDSGNAPDE